MKILDFNNNYNWTYIKAPVDIKAQDDDLIINFSLKFQTDIPEIVVIYHNINNYTIDSIQFRLFNYQFL